METRPPRNALAEPFPTEALRGPRTGPRHAYLLRPSSARDPRSGAGDHPRARTRKSACGIASTMRCLRKRFRVAVGRSHHRLTSGQLFPPRLQPAYFDTSMTGRPELFVPAMPRQRADTQLVDCCCFSGGPPLRADMGDRRAPPPSASLPASGRYHLPGFNQHLAPGRGSPQRPAPGLLRHLGVRVFCCAARFSLTLPQTAIPEQPNRPLSKPKAHA